MLLYGYAKSPLVLLPHLIKQLYELERIYSTHKGEGVSESAVARKMGNNYSVLERLREANEDFVLTLDPDDALALCADKKEGFRISLNILNERAEEFLQEPCMLASGKEVLLYRIPASVVGEMISNKEIILEPRLLSEVRRLAAEREKFVQEEQQKKESRKQPTFGDKLEGLFRRWPK